MYERYCQIRDHFKLKDADVAAMSGIPKSTFSDWKKQRSQPKEAKVEKISKVLNVTPEYLKGKTSFISCPFCDFEYNPLSEYSSNDHDIFHESFKKAKDKYPFLLSENNAISVLNKCAKDNIEGLSNEEQIEILEKEIVARYSLDWKKQDYALNWLDYNYYRLHKLSSILSEARMSSSLFSFVEHFPNEDSLKQLIQEQQADISAKLVENEQLLLLFSYITQLPKDILDFLEIQIKALFDAQKSVDNHLPKDRLVYLEENNNYNIEKHFKQIQNGFNLFPPIQQKND